jgi:hypothetical protein
MDTTTQQTLVSSFRNYFEGGNAVTRRGTASTSIKSVIEDNRRRYRMVMSDARERIDLGLSALPSTKSTSIVDNAVVDAIQEYYATDAITFTAEDDGSDVSKDHIASWFTKQFHIRAKKNAFWIWHVQSLKAGLVDGLEAGMVRWRKESYKQPDNHFYFLPTGEEIPEEEYKANKKDYPKYAEGAFDPATGKVARQKIRFEDHYTAVRQKKERIVADTWECIQLKPGENLLWDFKNPTLDLNRGQWCIVILQMPASDILNLVQLGVFDKISEEEIKPYLSSGSHSARQFNYTDLTSLGTDPDTVHMGEYNTVEVWFAFERKKWQWQVSYSIAGEKSLGEGKSVNKDFFGDRPFDRLPVVMGASDIELWEAMGRGIPKLIAPIEDELTDHRNNVNDIAKQAATGKYRVNETSDVDLNALLNDKVFFAKPGDVEKLDFAQEMAVVMRAADTVGADIASLAPVSMADNSLVGRGNAKDTLGSVQLAMGGNDKKLNARLLIRNVTFLQPMLRIIAEMCMAFETDQKLGKSAAKQAKFTPPQLSQIMDVVDGQQVVDWRNLDFDAEVQINAGLGVVPKQQKAAKVIQWEAWASAKGLPVDLAEVDKQIKVLNGFNEDQFILPEDQRQAPPPQVESKVNITIDFAQLALVAPEQAAALMQKLMAGAVSTTVTAKDQPKPAYLEEPKGSPSHPAAQAGMGGMDAQQGQMGGV